MPPKKIKTPEIEKPIEPLEVLEEIIPSDDEIQAPIPQPKPKRVLSEKQLECLAKGREKCHARSMLKDLKEEKKNKKIEVVNKAKKEIEDSIIKTAVKLKKKQLVVESKLAKYVGVDEDEEDIPDEVIRKIIKKKNTVKPTIQYNDPEPPQSLYYYL